MTWRVFSTFRHQQENASHLVEGNANRASIAVSSGFKIIDKDVFALAGKGGEESHFYSSPESVDLPST